MVARTIRSCSVCVVGGAGFLGSHLVDHLIEDRDCQVLVLDNLITGRKEFVNRRATFEHCDITKSEDHLLKLFKQHQVDYVFNYAAEPYIPVSFQRPLHVFDINAFGALKVINAAQEAGCRGILQVSSAEIYGDAKGKINENAPVIPHSTYGASKAAIDAMVQIRWREARTPVIALRQFNCVGERETHPYIVPEIISQLAADRNNSLDVPIVYLGNNSFRDFQYAGDAVRMATELLENGKFGEVYNMGSEEGIQIYDLADLLAKICGFIKVSVHVDENRVRPWEIWHLQSDNTKLYSVIQTRPQVTLKIALQRTVEYFSAIGQDWGW